jgi:hypothetical protein
MVGAMPCIAQSPMPLGMPTLPGTFQRCRDAVPVPDAVSDADAPERDVGRLRQIPAVQASGEEGSLRFASLLSNPRFWGR